jgi:hypothetical protein
MRMISQQLAEESPDETAPFNCSRPWLRRSTRETNGTLNASNPDVAEVLTEDGLAHVEK